MAFTHRGASNEPRVSATRPLVEEWPEDRAEDMEAEDDALFESTKSRQHAAKQIPRVDRVAQATRDVDELLTFLGTLEQQVGDADLDPAQRVSAQKDARLMRLFLEQNKAMYTQRLSQHNRTEYPVLQVELSHIRTDSELAQKYQDTPTRWIPDTQARLQELMQEVFHIDIESLRKIEGVLEANAKKPTQPERVPVTDLAIQPSVDTAQSNLMRLLSKGVLKTL